jgi:carbonic anhydrase/acetyltransferase-like protein (isoleucine patch superfamily)
MKKNRGKNFVEITILLICLMLTISLVYPTPLAMGQATVSNSSVSNNQWPNIMSNVKTFVVENVTFPKIDDSAYIHPFAIVIGDCSIGKEVLVAPTAVCRADEGVPIHVGDYSNIQDGVILHALDAVRNGINIDNKRFSQDGDRLLGNDTRFNKGYAVYISGNVSLAHDSLVHGPVWIGNNTLIGVKSAVLDSKIGNNVVIRIGSIITGVEIPDNTLVPPGSILTNQSQVDKLPSVIGSPSQNLNQGDLQNSQALATAYNRANFEG